MYPAGNTGSVPTLAGLTHREWQNRVAAVQRAAAAGKASSDPHLSLVALLADPAAEQRLAAVDAVSWIGAPIVPLLIAALAYIPPVEADARRAVAVAIGRIGPPARAALPLLQALANDPGLGDCVRSAIARIDVRRRWAAMAVGLALTAVAAGVTALMSLLPAGGVSPVTLGVPLVAVCVAVGVWWARPGPAALAWGLSVFAAVVIAAGVGGVLTTVFGRVTRALGGP